VGRCAMVAPDGCGGKGCGDFGEGVSADTSARAEEREKFLRENTRGHVFAAWVFQEGGSHCRKFV